MFHTRIMCVILYLLQGNSLTANSENVSEISITSSTSTVSATTAGGIESTESTTLNPNTTNKTGVSIRNWSKNPYFFEPPCPCVLAEADCDAECCFCDLGCELPGGKDGEPWLNTLYGDRCRNRKRFHENLRGLPSMELKERVLNEKTAWACGREDAIQNARQPWFTFLCVVLDNSHTSAYYKWKRPKTGFTDVGKVMKAPYAWTNNLPVDIPCTPDEEEARLGLFPKNATLKMNGTSTTTRKPGMQTTISPSKNKSRVKRQVMINKLCLSTKTVEVGKKLLVTNKTMKPWKMNEKLSLLPHALELGWAIMNLDHQPVSFFANFRPKPKETLNTCSKARYFLHAFSKLWVQLLVNETQGNARRRSFKFPVKQSSPLSSNTVELSETKLNESFPSNCQNIPLGLVIHAFHYRGKLVEVHYRHVIREYATVTPIPSFYIKLSSTPTIKPLKNELSRFWLQHALYECPHQFCWRDILDLTSLPTNRALLLVIGMAWILAGILLYTNPTLNTSWIC